MENLSHALKWVLLWQRKYYQIPLLPSIIAYPVIVSPEIRPDLKEGGPICCTFWMHWTNVSGTRLPTSEMLKAVLCLQGVYSLLTL